MLVGFRAQCCRNCLQINAGCEPQSRAPLPTILRWRWMLGTCSLLTSPGSQASGFMLSGRIVSAERPVCPSRRDGCRSATSIGVNLERDGWSMHVALNFLYREEDFHSMYGGDFHL